MPRRQIQPERRSHLDQHREEERHTALDLDRLQTQQVREHGRLVIGLPAAALLFVAPRFAFQALDFRFEKAQLAGPRAFAFSSK